MYFSCWQGLLNYSWCTFVTACVRLFQLLKYLTSYRYQQCLGIYEYPHNFKKIKGTVQRDFWLPFFSSFRPAWATDQWVKIFSILVKFSLSYLNFYESPRGIILRRVNLPGVSYSTESISLGQDTSASHVLKFESPQGMRPRRVTHDPRESTAIS